MKPVRKSKNGNDIYKLKVGEVEGVKKKYKSGKDGFFAFGKVAIDGHIYQISGNLVQLK